MRRRRAWITIACLLAIALLSWIEWMTGPDLSLSIFYLVPVAVAGWFAGPAAALITAFAAGALWLTVDAYWQQSSMGIGLWNSVNRLVIYITEGWLVARLRQRRDEMGQRLMEERKAARTDATTGLPNSRAFYEEATTTEEASPVALAFMDLDNFKNVNDRFGHAAGDEVLQKIAGALRAEVRPEDLSARLGGDEFAFLLRGVSVAQAHDIAQRLNHRVKRMSAHYPGSDLSVTIGIAWSPVPVDVETLVNTADAAMYQGKQTQKGSIQVREMDAPQEKPDNDAKSGDDPH